MKVLVLGGNGMLGHKLVQVLSKRFDVWTTLRNDFAKFQHLNLFDKEKTIEDVDAQKPLSYTEVIKDLKPDVIINSIGVIKQKSESKDIVKTLEINSIFPHKVAEIANEIGAKFITFSTDCIFDGVKGNYKETDQSNAFDLYGKSKFLGEVVGENCLTFRTSIIGREINSSRSLVEWFISSEGSKINGFTNAIYTGFPTIVLAEIVSDVIENHKELKGVYHLSSNPISKYDLLNLVKINLGLNIEIMPFDDFRIDRSLDSTRFREKTGFTPNSWEQMCNRMLEDNTPYKIWRKYPLSKDKKVG